MVDSNGSSYSEFVANNQIVSNAWNLVVTWYDPADKKTHCQVNNGAVIDGTALPNGPRLNNAQPFWLGNNNPSYACDGRADELAIWDRVLTADERAELFALGKGKFYAFD
jgi:hypothetical protein